MIRVLQVFIVLGRGGSETMIMNYYRNIDRSKVQFDFLVHGEEIGDYEEEVEKLGGSIYRVPLMKDFFNYQNALDAFFSKYKCKIIHSHINSQGAFVLQKAKKHKIPFRIAHSHIALSSNIDNLKSLIKLYLRKKLKKNATHYYACGLEAGEWLYGKESNFEIIPNAIVSENFKYSKKSRKKIRKELGVDEKFVIGHVGRFFLQKNHSYILKIYSELLKIKTESVLILVGDGSLRSQIEEESKKLGIYNDIFYLGVREDISDLLHAFDIFLFPSLYEGLPVTLIEAQCAGLKIFSSNTVTKEVEITDLITYLSLSEAPKIWAEHIVKAQGYLRKDYSKEVYDIYDIKANARKLQEKYIQLNNKLI